MPFATRRHHLRHALTLGGLAVAAAITIALLIVRPDLPTRIDEHQLQTMVVSGEVVRIDVVGTSLTAIASNGRQWRVDGIDRSQVQMLGVIDPSLLIVASSGEDPLRILRAVAPALLPPMIVLVVVAWFLFMRRRTHPTRG